MRARATERPSLQLSLVLFAAAGSIVVYLMRVMNFSDALYLIPIIFCSFIAMIHIFWLPRKNYSEKHPIKDEIEEIAFGHDDQFYLVEDVDE